MAVKPVIYPAVPTKSGEIDFNYVIAHARADEDVKKWLKEIAEKCDKKQDIVAKYRRQYFPALTRTSFKTIIDEL